MNTSLSHHAQLYAMNLVIILLARTRQSSHLTSLFRQLYQAKQREVVFLWTAIWLALALSGYLIGYLARYILPH